MAHQYESLSSYQAHLHVYQCHMQIITLMQQRYHTIDALDHYNTLLSAAFDTWHKDACLHFVRN